MKPIYSRFWFRSTGFLTINEEQMNSDLEFFHDCNTKQEELYTDDVVSLLQSPNVDDN